jgi:tetratricopeptide (TPR) repeat protein
MYPKNRDKKNASLGAYWIQKIWLCWLVGCTPLVAWGQSSTVVDSLQAVLKTDISDKQKTNTYIKLAQAYSKRKDSTQTSHYLAKATTLAHRLHDGKALVDIWRIEGIWFNRLGHYEAAKESFQKIVSLPKQYQYPKGKAGGYGLLGILEELHSNYTSSLKYYQLALAAFEQLKDEKGIGNSENNIGNIFFKKGLYDEALKHHFRALAIREKLQDTLNIAKSYNNLGMVYLREGNFPKSLLYYLKSVKIKEKFNDLAGIAATFNNISVLYLNQEKYDEALDYLFRTLKLSKKIKQKRGMINAYNNIGLIYHRRHNSTQAIKFFNKALHNSQLMGIKVNVAKAYNNLARVYIDKKQYAKAEANVRKAWQINQEVQATGLEVSCYILLGRIHYKRKQYTQAQKNLEKGVALASKMKRPVIVKEGAEPLAETYAALGLNKQAYETHKLFKKMTDSLFNQSNTQKITRLASEYEFQKEKDSLKYQQEKEKVVLNAQLKQEQLSSSFQRNIIVLVLGVLVVVSILAFFLYRSQKQQKELNIELMLQGEELQQNKEEVASQRDILEVKNNELSRHQYRIAQSFKAAQVIQHSLLPSSYTLQKFFSDHFVLYKPKDVVSGDFYWLGKCREQLIMVIADCTGHGVPGAFMTLIASKLLDSIVKINRINQPADILIALNQEIKQSIGQPQEERQTPIDMLLGLDAVVLNITHQAEDRCFEIGFAGAKNNLIYYDANTGVFGELKGVRKSVGGFQNKKSVYEQQQLLLPPQSILYAGSDGLPDQNNELRKRFGYDHLKKLLAQNVHKSMSEQATNLDEALQKHMQHNEQRDDILWMGLKL